MDVHECIRNRRSTRSFKPDEVAPDAVERLLEAIRWSPSWANMQPWEVVVVRDPGMKESLQQTVPQSNPGRKAVVEAPLVFVMCGRLGKSGFYKGKQMTEYGDWAMFDVALACQNLCLAARAEGLGSLHLGLLDHRKAAEVLGLPKDVVVYELIPVGYPAKESTAPKRREPHEFCHADRFGTPWGQ